MVTLYVQTCIYLLVAGNGKAGEGVSPVPVASTVPRVHLTLNHLVFHKVLGKGSFGKVCPMIPISEHVPEFNIADV